MALVDGDPYGLDILSVYNYGSRALKHENERLAAGGRVVWIGIWASEFSRCVLHFWTQIVERFSALHRLGVDRDKLPPISKGDEKKANCVTYDAFESPTDEAASWLPLKAFAMLNRSKELLPTRWR